MPAIPTWYAGLVKPVLTPPSWFFGPVLVFLYALMGIAVFIVRSRRLKTPNGGVALGVFGVQLILNVLWSAVFFGLHA
ncbi:MAG: tryptophan-rich sensory protein [Patescibacteria group bacterium]|nr:tryptophan-rich sensory protein [Patescibacteria group bacterium]MCL5224412.1 tryptophan-rich sensory protein [Patescibacteria group bacterium]